jgi:hypothetical protein
MKTTLLLLALIVTPLKAMAHELELAEKKILFLQDENSSLHNKLTEKESALAETLRVAHDQQHYQQIREHELIASLLLSPEPHHSQGGSRHPASAMTENLANQLNQLIYDHQLKAQSNEGQIILTLNEDFIFTSDEVELNELNRIKLHSLFMLYATMIFENEELKDSLVGVEFIGHASPWFNGQFVHPLDASEQAYQHNLKVSLERARSLARFIYSDSFGDFPFKNALRQMTRVSGLGFTDPLQARSPASETKTCGGFDCQASRRVEIIFYFDSTQEQ